MLEKPIIHYIKNQFIALTNQENALAMAAYMKTTMPFYGIRAVERRAIVKVALKQYPIQSQEEYLEIIDLFWSQSYREEKYVAIDIARAYSRYVNLATIPLFEKMIRDGAWWDFVDDIAVNLIGTLILKHEAESWSIIEGWINDSHVWIRRAAIICQNKFKKKTDQERLFTFCLLRAHENDFFIRKAIGWALREYAKTAPHHVDAFVTTNKKLLSSLSYTQATKLFKKEI